MPIFALLIFALADLSYTCLDEKLLISSRKFVSESGTPGYLIVYRTKHSQHIGDTEYLPGNTYDAPVFSFSAETDCHPGIYAASLTWMQKNYPNKPLVKCRVANGDWIITAKGAIRCARLEVLEDVV